MIRIGPQPWLTRADTGAVMRALGADRGEARFVGGCVRNALLGAPVGDIDIAVPYPPEETMARLARAGLKAVPTGIDHGTVTAVVGKRPFEVTTLRHDVETDGRRAVVQFTDDWAADAARRDFTLNALYADLEGMVYDPTGEGIEDLEARRIRFIGSPVERIREDYLRILRFFRMVAWYGEGELDAAALRACAEERQGLQQLSAERVQKELLRLLEADAAPGVLRAMAATGVLAEILPERLDLDLLEKVVAVETGDLFVSDPVRRLGALVIGREGADKAEMHDLAERLRLSNADRDRLEALAEGGPALKPYLSMREVRRLLYRTTPERFADRLVLAWADDPKKANGVQWRALLAIAESWERPVFPLSGADVMKAGVPKGPAVGRILAEVEDWWVDSDFSDDPFSLAERLKAIVQASDI